MATHPVAPGASLFNNPALSDIKIKQHYKGKVLEYHAHKAILGRASQFFLKAFTGNFKEASDNVMAVHDDIPEQFELALKYMYTGVYNGDDVSKLADGNDQKRVQITTGLCGLADKYGIDRLLALVVDDVKTTLSTKTSDAVVITAICTSYSVLLNTDTPLGEALSELLIKHYPDFLKSVHIKDMIRRYPLFAADLALNLHARGTFGMGKTEKMYGRFYGFF